MAGLRRAGRWFSVGTLLVALLAGCGGRSYTNIVVQTPEGRVSGRVLLPTGAPASGVPVTITPPSVVGPSTVNTGTDGRFDGRAPAGAVTLSIGGATTTSTTATATVATNQTADVGTVVLAPAQGSAVAGNQPPAISGATMVLDTTVTTGGAATVSATVTDPDTPDTGLTVVAYAVTANGTVVGITPLTAQGGGAWSGRLTWPATTSALTVLVSATDTPGSNQTVQAVAGTVPAS